ncbi:MAG TPA: HAMP domain-containing sensor histidine kinase [Candidatus Acidoferrum sp.]|nr:HAMP domain-containing sensor histidine kinase [Candidatus Acidoferrum sp.]
MPGTIATSTTSEHATLLAVPFSLLKTLLESLETPAWIAEQNGRVIFANTSAKRPSLWTPGNDASALNLFRDVFKVEPNSLRQRLAQGEYELELKTGGEEAGTRARLHWIADPGYFVVQTEAHAPGGAAPEAATQLTVQELLQEREITYRNLLAAYLKLQEVNRQKTVFLASAAHELKTPLAVIKGYYDLMLAGSLGRLTDKQKDILEESKDSCERLVRLVSMFLNYSALESGKLVLQLRENDLRDCLEELTKRWSEAFQRKGVRLEAAFDPSIPTFRFDYQKVQQAAANLLDNSLKHTPAGGMVTLQAAPHFWERRVAAIAPVEERRRFRLPRPNSVEVCVLDTGPGIAAEHHQEIFEDFVRVDRNTSGMGLGLAIAKRLIQAHRGKIWVESKSHGGSKFIFLLPMDQG